MKPFIDEENKMHLLGKVIPPGKSTRINISTAKLHSHTVVEVPVIIERSKKKGPVVLITAGIHGDEINGVEVVRQLIAKKLHQPKKGSIICIPVLNIYGFINNTREFPDGRDLNRVFPGSKTGALASRFAHLISQEILPIANLCMDFHTGGASRFNAAQIRIDKKNKKDFELAKVFHAPFTMFSSNIKKSYRYTCEKLNIPALLFEGGKSNHSDKYIAMEGVNGIKRILNHLGMLKEGVSLTKPGKKSIIIEDSYWLRAKYSGLLHIKIPLGKFVEKGEYIAIITDPYGTFRHKVKAKKAGYVINANQAPTVYQGDAIFHISKEAEE